MSPRQWTHHVHFCVNMVVASWTPCSPGHNKVCVENLYESGVADQFSSKRYVFSMVSQNYLHHCTNSSKSSWWQTRSMYSDSNINAFQ